ncbi:MAG: hypothetical protein IPK00_15320 [Deltaproteobacteria bacterium]|nr:hypothetical protein [Deltaproteobacteria bacterium]
MSSAIALRRIPISLLFAARPARGAKVSAWYSASRVPTAFSARWIRPRRSSVSAAE